MSWTNVPKAGPQTYIKPNQARPTYDESTISYDDAGVYYDGFNPSQWTSVAHPGAQSWTNIAKPN